MSFWDWLWSKTKGDDGILTRLSTTTSDAPAPQMTSIQVSAPSAVRPVFSIQTAIELLRTLPVDDEPELVLRVVRKTLRSTGVEVEEIIRSAKNQEDALVGGVATDRAAIELLQQQIALRHANIERLEAELAETRSARERLEEAVRTETKVGPLLKPEDLARLQAEAAPPKPPPVPAPGPAATAAAPGASAPPRPAPKPLGASVPPIPKKSFAPKLPSQHAGAAPASAPRPAAAPADSIPDVAEIDDAFAEPTANHALETPVPDGGGKDD